MCLSYGNILNTLRSIRVQIMSEYAWELYDRFLDLKRFYEPGHLFVP